MNKSLVLLFSAALFFSCSKNNENQDEDTHQTFVLSDEMLKTTTFADAEKKYVKEEQTFYGKISADKNKYVDVYPLVGGNVISVNAELGDYVHQGQILATIRSTEMAGFQKDMSDARTSLAIAQNNLRVAQEMYAGKLNTEKDVLEAKAEVERAQQEVKKSNVVNSVYNVKSGSVYNVVAPISGYIVAKNIADGMQLRSDRSDNIFDVADTKNVWALINVNESDIDKISLGMNAEVSTLAYQDQVFKGTVDKIFKIIDKDTNAMQARVILDNSQDLLVPESKARIKLTKFTNEQRLAVPSSAIIFDKSKNFVMVFHDKKNIETREVKVNSQVGDTTYIDSGLREGEKVLTHNQLLVYDALND